MFGIFWPNLSILEQNDMGKANNNIRDSIPTVFLDELVNDWGNSGSKEPDV